MTGSLFQTLFNITDTFYAGKISQDALATLAKAFPLYFLIISAGSELLQVVIHLLRMQSVQKIVC